MKAPRNPNKSGGILLMAMLMVLFFSILTIGLYKLFDTDAMETLSVEHHRRAFWMAEMGLEEVVDRVFRDESFRNSPNASLPYTVPYAGGSFSNASYTIESIDINTPFGTTGLVYTITSRGTAGSMNRRLQQDIWVRPGSPHALRSMSGDIDIDSNVYIDGDVFVDVGDVHIDAKENLNPLNPTGVDGYVIAGGNVDGKGASSVDTIEMPSPPPPSIDINFWDQFDASLMPYLNTNGLDGVSAIDITTGVSNYNFSTMESTEKLVIDGTASGTASTVSNFHYMVSATSIDFKFWLTLESRTIIVVDGDVNIGIHLEVYDDCVIFATGNITVAQSSAAGGTGATLIAMGDIVLAQNSFFNGIIFAEGTVDVGSNAEISGTIIGGEGINIGSNAEITFDPDVFLNPLPGLKNIFTEANLTPLQWREIAPQ